jgi:hypothetical protein
MPAKDVSVESAQFSINAGFALAGRQDHPGQVYLGLNQVHFEIITSTAGPNSHGLLASPLVARRGSTVCR